MRPTRPKTPAKVLRISKENLYKAPVRVYCRIRQPRNTDPDAASGCITVEGNTCVKVTPPSDYTRTTTARAVKCTFREVFPQDSTQVDVFNKVAHPLVENLMKGMSGLLFAYGVTGSGKTYTMTGEPNNPGIMPRCLDVIFNSIENVQARRYIFKPDRCNTFDIQSEVDAALQRQQQMYKAVPKSAKKNNSNPDLAVNTSECSKISSLDEDCLYSVFVNYIEIYNNIVYDLLDEGTIGRRSPLTKIIREDSNHNMYVHGVTEVEVKSREEALEVFYKGLKRKRMAYTTLNSESSRSHSVFTIRLVRASVDSIGESVVQDKKFVSITQLSLVDLAGSERTSRTNNIGQRLREAGNINNSLMTLRACLEALRENQQSGSNARIVPYRDSKMTHLFKNFFDGEGHVKMIVCINPSSEDFDETLQVMRFAEVAMEVEVTRPKPLMDFNMGMTPGRRKANLIHKQAVSRLCADGKANENQFEIDLTPVYSLGGDLPSLELGSIKAEELIRQLIPHLEMRIQRRSVLLRERTQKAEKFRSQLDNLVKSNLFTNTETATLKAQLEQERARNRAIEQRLVASEETNALLQRQINVIEMHNNELKQKLDDKDMMLNQKVMENENQKRKFNQKKFVEQAKSKELEIKLKAQRDKLKKTYTDQNEKIQLVTQILSSDKDAIDARLVIPRKSKSTENVNKEYLNKENATVTSPTSKRGYPVVNLRHKRSLSADGPTEKWLEHVPKHIVPLGSIMQPIIPKRKSVNKLDMKDITNKLTSNYCLMSQEQDTDGELETKFYKGDILPTCGGGAQVVFRDVEMLSHKAPISNKKRDIPETPTKSNRGSDSKKPRI